MTSKTFNFLKFFSKNSKEQEISSPVHAEYDFAVAYPAPETIPSQGLLQGLERGLERWESMHNTIEKDKSDDYRVRVDVSPGPGPEDKDMVGQRNEDWNLRTLILLTRAGLIELTGFPNYDPDKVGKWINLKIIDQNHLDKDTWEKKVSLVRQKISVWL